MITAPENPKEYQDVLQSLLAQGYLSAFTFDQLPNVDCDGQECESWLMAVELAEHTIAENQGPFAEHRNAGGLIRIPVDREDASEVLQRQRKVRAGMIVQALWWAAANGYLNIPDEALRMSPKMRERYTDKPTEDTDAGETE